MTTAPSPSAPAAGETYEKPAHGWTCFHCGETFKTVGAAKAHFGADPSAEPGCLLRVKFGGERGLLMALRDCEDRLARALADDSDVIRAWIAAQGRHSNALNDAEEAGYARGLGDAAHLLAERDRLREALSFYAAPGIYQDDGWSDRPRPIIEDGGKRARAALGVQP